MSLQVALTDLNGNYLSSVPRFTDGQVEVPLSDSRTGQFTVSVFEPVTALIKPLSVMAKMWWNGYLVFWGYVLTPHYSGSDGTLQVSCLCPSLKLKKHFHRWGDFCVEEAIAPDGLGMQILMESAMPTESQLERGVKGLGMYYGYNSVAPVTEEGLWSKITRGTNVWESMTTLAESAIGAEFDIRPVDGDHPPTTGTRDTGPFIPPWWEGREQGMYAQLDTWTTQGEDSSHKEDNVVWHHGWGRQNAIIDFEPSGDEEINYAVVNKPGGEDTRVSVNQRALAHSDPSWRSIGIYETWEQFGDENESIGVLTERAKALVNAYNPPPQHFTVTPNSERPGVYSFPEDFYVGDYCRAVAKQGYYSADAVGRITKVTLSDSRTEAASVTLDCLPYNPEAVEEDPS